MNNLKQSITPNIMESMDSNILCHCDNDPLEGYYIGEVVDVKDPEKLGRCRLRVGNVYGDETAVGDLPWAIPEASFIGSLKGSMVVPPVGALVYVRFDKGEIYLPVYGNKVLNTSQLPTNKDVDYPNTLVFFETDNGDKFEINTLKRTTTFEHASGSKVVMDDKKVEIEHLSGSKITIDTAGNVTIDSVGNVTTKHGLFLEDNGSAVIPTGVGPYMALPTCPLTGMVLTGQRCAPGGP